MQILYVFNCDEMNRNINKGSSSYLIAYLKYQVFRIKWKYTINKKCISAVSDRQFAKCSNISKNATLKKSVLRSVQMIDYSQII